MQLTIPSHLCYYSSMVLQAVQPVKARPRKPVLYKPMENPPNAIHGLRMLLGYTAEHVGRAIGVRGSQIRRAERQGYGMGRSNWAELAAFFGVQPYELHDPTLPERIRQAREGEAL